MDILTSNVCSHRFTRLPQISRQIRYNKNAFQQDAYRPLVARISQHALLPGGLPQCMLGYHPPLAPDPPPPRLGTPRTRPPLRPDPPRPGTPRPHLPPAPHLPGPGTPPPMNRITDTCKNITLPQLRCGR